MEILDRIPFEPGFEDFAGRVRLAAYPDMQAAARQLMEEAAGRLRPKAIYQEAFIRERTEDKVDLGVVTFRSRAMSENLRDVERAFLYIATCGRGMEELDTESDDLLRRYWVDVLKEMALEGAVRRLKEELHGRFGLDKLSSMNPGSGNRDVWPIGQQRELFSVFGDMESLIGVTLTRSFLMLPNKTVSGLYFPTEVPFESCQLCTRESCPRRRTPYRGSLPGH